MNNFIATILGLFVTLALLLQVLIEAAITIPFTVVLAHCHRIFSIYHLPIQALLRQSSHLIFSTLSLLVLLSSR